MKTVLVVLFLLFICFDGIRSECPISEQNALNTFYSQTYGNSWRTRYGWTSSGCCSRYGVQCDATNSTVVSINLYYNWVDNSGTINIDLTALTNLTTFNLGNNYMTIRDIFMGPKLTYLNLEGSTYYGVGPAFKPQLVYFQAYSYTSNLTLTSTSSLEVFICDSCNVPISQMTGANFPNLTVLSVNNLQGTQQFSNFLTNLCGLTKLESISSLQLVNTTQTTFPSCFAQLPSLTEVMLAFEFTGPFPTFSENVTRIELSNSFFTTQPVLPSNIVTFICSNCSIGGELDSQWLNLPNLIELDVSSNGFYGEFPAKLIQQIQRLDVSNNNFTGTLDIFQYAQNFSSYTFHNNKLYGGIPEFFNTQLIDFYLDVSNNSLEGAIEFWLACVQTIDITGNPLLIAVTPFQDDVGMEGGPLNFCTPNYLFILNTLQFSEVPINGGWITISTPYMFMGERPEMMMMDTSSTSEGDQQLVSRLSNSNNILAEESFENYLYTQYGKEIRDLNTEESLHCKWVNWVGTIRCLVGPQSNYTNGLHLALIDYRTDQYYIDSGFYIEPTITSISPFVPFKGGNVTIKGTSFGNPQLTSTISLSGEDGSHLPCPIIDGSDTEIICRAPKIKKNDTIVYNVELQLNGISYSSPSPITYYKSNAVLQQCRGNPNLNVDCNGRGTCSPLTGCSCNNNYFGTYCEIDMSVSVDQDYKFKLNPDQPTSIVSRHTSVADYNISVIEVRELDITNNVVRRISPVWSKTNEVNQVYTYEASLAELPAILVRDNSKNGVSVHGNTGSHGGSVRAQSNNIIVNVQLFSSPSKVEFAENSMQMVAGTVKYSVEMTGYTFKNPLNTLQVVFKVDSLTSDAYKSGCGTEAEDSRLVYDPNFTDQKYLQMIRGNSYLLSKFNNKAYVDGRVSYIGYQTEVTTTKNQVNILANVPHFTGQVSLDPDFSTLLNVKGDDNPKGDCSGSVEKSNKTMVLATSLAVSLGVATALAVAGVIYHRKKVQEARFKKDMSAKLAKINQN